MRLEQLNSELIVQAREDKDFIISAVTSECYNIIRFKYGSWMDQNGSAGAYILITEIVDNIMFSNDSLYLRTLVKTNGFEEIGFGEATDTDCFDWYFMTECSKELENRLKGWSYDDSDDSGLRDLNVSNANDMILGLLGDLKEGDRNVILEEIKKKFGSTEIKKKKEVVVDLTITKEDFLQWYFNYGQDTEIRDSRYDIGECIIGQLLKTGVGSISAQEIFDGCSHDSVRAYFTQEHYMLTDKYDVELSDLGIKYNLTLID